MQKMWESTPTNAVLSDWEPRRTQAWATPARAQRPALSAIMTWAIRHGAAIINLHNMDDGGKTPMHHARSQGRPREMAEFAGKTLFQPISMAGKLQQHPNTPPRLSSVGTKPRPTVLALVRHHAHIAHHTCWPPRKTRKLRAFSPPNHIGPSSPHTSRPRAVPSNTKFRRARGGFARAGALSAGPQVCGSTEEAETRGRPNPLNLARGGEGDRACARPRSESATIRVATRQISGM